MLMYNREPVLPFDVKHNLDIAQPIFSSATKVRTTIADDAADSSKAAQKKQKRDYDSRHTSKTEINVVDIVLLKSNKRFDRLLENPVD